MSVVEIKLMKISNIFIDFFKKQAESTYNINIRFSFLNHLPKILFELLFITTLFVLFIMLFYFNFSEEKNSQFNCYICNYFYKNNTFYS